MQKILIIDDQPDLLKVLEINLSKEGYQVFKADSGTQGLKMAIQVNPHLILLDVMMPDISGLDVCRELRRKGIDTPIIMLTAKAEEIDRVVGLELGADDYMTKPFSLHELKARIRARLRRLPPHAGEKLAKYSFGHIEIDFEGFLATSRGKELELTPKEFDILRLLIRHRGEVVTRERLLNEVWGYEASPTTRTVDSHILNLRKKVEEDPSNPKHLISVYGGGYMFVG
jgi:two-component system, OmpR family, alkaline phosphatase synthesis response regulator PhoP